MAKVFLNGVIETARDSINTFKEIVKLRQYYEEKIMDLGRRSKKAQKLLLYLFSYPVVDNKKVMNELAISFNSANRLIGALVD